MDVVTVFQSTTHLWLPHHFHYMIPWLKLHFRRTKNHAIYDHPLAQNKVCSAWKYSLQNDIANNTDSQTIAEHIGQVLFDEGNIKAIIRPFFEEIECWIEEGFRDYKADGAENREIFGEDEEEEKDGCVVEKKEDEAFDLIWKGVKKLWFFLVVGLRNEEFFKLSCPWGHVFCVRQNLRVIEENVSMISRQVTHRSITETLYWGRCKYTNSRSRGRRVGPWWGKWKLE